MSIQNSHQISDIKILLKKGASGSTITDISKTGTVGLVDTYTVTLSDGGKYTFEVTNGSNIQSIAKTGTSGLVDTYTVTLTNGDTTTFTVTNGNGIASIAKTSAVGEVDTYTITFTDGSATTFDVTNGDNWIDNGIKDATDFFQTITGGLLKSCVVIGVPVQSGSGDPSPSNVRTISGHIQAKADRSAKNMFGAPYSSASGTSVGITSTINDDGSVRFKGTPSSQYYFNFKSSGNVIKLKAGTYTLSNLGGVIPSNCSVYFMVGGSSNFINGSNPSRTITLESDSVLTAYMYANSNAGYIDVTVKLQLEHGLSATSFEPYVETEYTQSLGQTVYGFTLDLVSGVMTIDKKIKTGFTKGSIDSSGKLYNIGDISDISLWTQTGLVSPNIICSHFVPYSLEGARATQDKCIVQYQNSIYIGGYVGDESTLDTILESMQVAYELATPITVQLTPQQVVALVGQNNLSCPLDGQSMDSVKYRYLYTYEEEFVPLETWVHNAGNIVWSDPVSASSGATSCTITDDRITTDSIIEVFSSSSNNSVVFINSVSVTAGQAVLSFNALGEATDFRVRITNL